jgi:hypothetical protein
MTDQRRSRFQRAAGVLGRLAPAILAALGLVIVTGAGGSRTDALVTGPSLGGFHGPTELVGPTAPGEGEASRAAVPQEIPDFTHSDHESVECQSCHTSLDTHGELSVTTITDCRSCHHTAPVSASCATCHTGADAPDETFRETRAVAFSVGTSDPSRVMSFPHDRHDDLDCATCHTQGLTLAPPPDLDCTSCHEEHHTAQANCAACHRQPPVSAHPTAQAHVTCTGSGCHTDVPFATVPRTRAFCLGCHQDQVDHEPGRTCSECHALPAPLPQAGGGQ